MDIKGGEVLPKAFKMPPADATLTHTAVNQNPVDVAC